METTTGIYEQSTRADGRLRRLDSTYNSTPDDPVLPQQLIQRFALRPGVQVEVELGRPMGGQQGQNGHHQHNFQGGGGRRGRNKKNRGGKSNSIAPNAQRVNRLVRIEGQEPEAYAKMRRFEDLTTIDPHPRLTLEYPDCPPACRLIDLFCPIGYGQRGLIVSPPKAGKTTLLQNIAFAVQKNHPEVEVIALLIDERPEEVTDFRRNVPCTVWASSNDHTPDKHASLAMLAMDRCRRMTEQGRDVVVLLDSLTRLGRAFNNAPQIQGTGRTLSGGIDAGALSIPRQIFAAARKFQEGGSLTIIATALVDTGSRGDEVIFEEFKGTGNMELVLDRKIAEQRVFPAINLAASGTRKEHLLIEKHTLDTVSALRRRLLNMPPAMQMEQLLKALERFKSNAELVGNPQSPASAQGAARVGM